MSVTTSSQATPRKIDRHPTESQRRTMTPAIPVGRRAVTVFIATVLVLGMGAFAVAGPAAAATDDDEEPDRKIATIDLEISDEEFTIDDVHLSGPGLPDEQIDERTYTLEKTTIQNDGLTFTLNDTKYQVCELDIVIDDVSFSFQDVTLSSE